MRRVASCCWHCEKSVRGGTVGPIPLKVPVRWEREGSIQCMCKNRMQLREETMNEGKGRAECNTWGGLWHHEYVNK